MSELIKQFLFILGETRSRIPLLVLAFIFLAVLELIGLGLLAPFIASVIDPGLQNDFFIRYLNLDVSNYPHSLILTALCVGIVCTFFLKAVFSILVNFWVIKFCQNQRFKMRRTLMVSFQNMPYTEYIRRNTSDYIYSITILTGQFITTLQSLLRLTSEGLLIVSVFSFLVITNGVPFLLAALVMGSFVSLYDLSFKSRLKKMGEELNTADTDVQKSIIQGLNGLKEIRVLNQERYFLDKLAAGARVVAQKLTLSQVISMAPKILMELLIVLIVVGLIYLTLSSSQNASEVLASVGIFGVASLKLAPSLNLVSTAVAQIRFSKDGIRRLFEDIAALQISRDAPQGHVEMHSEPFKSLELVDVTYTYPAALEPALKNITLMIRKGETLGIMGSSGSGKTTLVDNLLGLLNPEAGSIYYNERKSKEYNFARQKKVAYLPQETFLTDDTMKRNVALGVSDDLIDENRVIEALTKAKLNTIVELMESGIETRIGDRGIRLSGGQRQRVALARAFYHNREVLILDESTSALDTKTEDEIVSELNELKGSITMILIAHRLSTLRNCDRIVKLEKGTVVDQGPPDKMLKGKL